MPLRIEEPRPKPIIPAMFVTGPLPLLKIDSYPTVWTSIEGWCTCRDFREFHPVARKRRTQKPIKKEETKPPYSTMEYIA